MAAALVAARAGPRVEVGLLVGAGVALAATLASPGLQGVHRWIDLGPLHLNVAQIVLPAAIVALAGQGRRLAVLTSAVLLGVLAAQPDASQATALGAALLILILPGRSSRATRAAALVAIAVAVSLSWLRPDPLGPVPEVEQIMALAWTASPALGVGAWCALIGACLSPRLSRGRPATALAAYALVTAVAPLAGWYPVPLVGMSMSPILGLWLGEGLLAAQARRPASACSPAASDA